jgi:hypothetical protein
MGVDVVKWSRALDVRLSEWCCSVSMVWVQIPSREEQKFDSSIKSNSNTVWLYSYGQEFASYVRQSWKRFLDDCFIIWNSDITVEIFHTELNSLNDQIRFTINRSKIEMTF